MQVNGVYSPFKYQKKSLSTSQQSLCTYSVYWLYSWIYVPNRICNIPESHNVIYMCTSDYYSFSQMLKLNFWNHAGFSQNCKHKLQLSKSISQNSKFLLQKQTIASKQFYVCSKPNSILKSETTQSNEITNEAVSKHYTKKWKAQLSDVYMSFFMAINTHFQLKKAKLLMYMYCT